MTNQRLPRVFISYRHESDQELGGVLYLADRWRDEGIDAVIDQYESHRPEGCTRWCERQIESADFVLLVCTEAYNRSVRGEEQPGAAHGVLWEARLFSTLLYNAGSSTSKFIPIIFSTVLPITIPSVFSAATRYVVDTEQGWEDLYRQLTNQPKTRKRQLGSIRKLPERPRRWREQPLPSAEDGEENRAHLRAVPDTPDRNRQRPA